MNTEDLFTATDVKRVRDLLYKEQHGLCKLTGIELESNKAVLDHLHDNEQLVRGVLHRFGNTTLGKIENLHKRYLSFWYPGTLSDFLRQCADYIEKEPDSRFRHNGWIKKVQTLFNSLSEGQKNQALAEFNVHGCKNATERKKSFKEVVLSRKFSYNQIRAVLLQVKGE